MITLTRKNCSSTVGHVHTDAALQLTLEGHDGAPHQVIPVGGDLEGALLLSLEVVYMCPDLVDALQKRLHVLLVKLAT